MNSPAERAAAAGGCLAVFEQLVREAEYFQERGALRKSVACAAIAAHYACARHPGIFASPRLERVLLDAGDQLAAVERPSAPAESPRRVLHVLTQAYDTGGHTRTVWRWIAQDVRRVHSVVLTEQGDLAVPSRLETAVQRSGGGLHRIDRPSTDAIGRAGRLASIAAAADRVILHAHSRDVVPVIAFARPETRPPVILLNKSDHVFWLGVGISDVVAHMRDAGAHLAGTRRGVEQHRSGLIPIPLTPIDRERTRRDAKHLLGLDPDSVVLLTIATAYKYEREQRPDFVEAVLSILQRHSKTVLVAIGPQLSGSWEKASKETGGRVRALGHRADTATFYESADIYLDSFPFASNTSLLEAGSYGVPLVGFSPHGAAVDVLKAGAPGLADMTSAGDVDTYRAVIDRLIENPDERERLGERTRLRIRDTHVGEAWLRHVEETYALAGRVGPVRHLPAEIPAQPEGELDTAVAALLSAEGASADVDGIVEQHLRALPLTDRWKVAVRLRRVSTGYSRSALLPSALEYLLDKAKLHAAHVAPE